jgi:hypothetical protein
MSKKTLLEESAVRKMMKFANIGKLADNFVNETYGMYEDEEEALDAPVATDEFPPEAGGLETDDLPPEPEGEVDMGEMGEKEQMLADVVQAVADTLGVEVETHGAGEEMGLEGEPEMDFTAAADTAPEDEGDEPVGAEDDEEGMMMEEGEVVEEDGEVVEGVDMTMDEDSIVQETVKRVTARLKSMKEAKKKEDLVESITSRIIDALRSKK